MNKENNEELDDLFKKKLEDPIDEIGYKEEDWAALKQMLDGGKKRKGIIYWLPVISSAAALLLFFLGWWSFKPKATQKKSQNRIQLVHNHRDSDAGSNSQSKRQPGDISPKPTPPSVNYADNHVNDKSSGGRRSYVAISGRGSSNTVAADQNDGKNLIAKKADEELFAESPTSAFKSAQVIEQPVSPIDLSAKNNSVAADGKSLPKNNKIKPSSSAVFRPQYSISILAAPDINGVGSFQQSKVGTNVGLLFSAGVFKKLTITTGVIYSDKPYATPFNNYHTAHQFSTAPINVDANCSMLDIPINVSYQFYNKQQNKISFGAGLSSYLMLRESYQFNYSNPYATGPSTYVVPNSKGYLFGVLNLNATYQRQINSKFALGVQPYLKLPLTDLGYSQVRLQSMGLALGVSWNLVH